MNKYHIGYIVTVFWWGNPTKFKYVGGGEWEFLSGENTTARYKQLLDMVSKWQQAKQRKRQASLA